MFAKVIAETTVHNQKVAIGEIIEVDEHTLRNLVAKGRLEEVSKDEVDTSKADKAAAKAKAAAAKKLAEDDAKAAAKKAADAAKAADAKK